MKLNIFYSWQSDLPNNSNRGFIQSIIEKVVKELNKEYEFFIDLNVDRDTKDETGTPEIIATILKKIDSAYIFIADTSIINSEPSFREDWKYNLLKFLKLLPTLNSGRLTPNPNVLFELGYASEVVGWDKILCFYNLDYGKIEDLPFDIRTRRPITYELKDEDKPKVKKALVKIVKESIEQTLKNNPPERIINPEIKKEIDTELLSTLNHIKKFLFSEKQIPFAFPIVKELLQIDSEYIKKKLKDKKLLGFHVLKNWGETEKTFTQVLENPISKLALKDEISQKIVKLIWKIKGLDKIFSNTYLYEESGQISTSFKVKSGIEFNPENTEFPDRYVLLRIMDEKHATVEDHGDFTPNITRKDMLREYVVKDKSIEYLCSSILDVIKEMNEWIEMTDNEIIIEEAMFKLVEK